MKLSSTLLAASAFAVLVAAAPAPAPTAVAGTRIPLLIKEAPDAAQAVPRSAEAGDIEARAGGCGACAQLSDGNYYKTCWASYLGYYTYFLELC